MLPRSFSAGNHKLSATDTFSMFRRPDALELADQAIVDMLHIYWTNQILVGLRPHQPRPTLLLVSLPSGPSSTSSLKKRASSSSATGRAASREIAVNIPIPNPRISAGPTQEHVALWVVAIGLARYRRLLGGWSRSVPNRHLPLFVFVIVTSRGSVGGMTHPGVSRAGCPRTRQAPERDTPQDAWTGSRAFDDEPPAVVSG
ncbi:unnamed protein product [Cyprideis torosa]|uniref:Uncharacterized protein n=1 Tax=Cyprideis torosa TaxID=163714 RepID=A0A7R8WAJ6_9CRUS|nr:unnamed protein product [Cyprideis torosa]CAG0885389.1 unnamed protein product [Cyprideis torosa]